MMVGVRGFEPPTSRSRTVRSTKLSHTPYARQMVCLNSALGRLACFIAC